MRLALRLALTFGLLSAASSVLVGVAARQRLVEKENLRFQTDVQKICERVTDEIKRQGEADQALVDGMCQGTWFIERIGIALDNGTLDDVRAGFPKTVETQRRAFKMDELLVGTDAGDIVGASPTSLLSLPAKDVDILLRGDATKYAVRGPPVPALVSRCTTKTLKGRTVGMVGARHVGPLLERVARTVDATLVPSWPYTPPAGEDATAPTTPPPPKPTPKPPKGGKGANVPASAPSHVSTAGASASAVASAKPAAATARETCVIDDHMGAKLTFDVVKSTRTLDESLEAVDRAVGVAAIIAAVVAFLASVLLARSVSRPLSVLATEAGKVAAGDARPLRVRGSGEVRDLVSAFDRMIQDLAVTRRRLAATSRVAAWREVARRVAHEVKNPLAPIRAAVETLRRLRAREDPRFDEYFDEATRTVLDEVHRISNIVTEFTRFARLPTPKPQDVDVEDVARHIIQVHKATAEDVVFAHHAQRRAPTIRADRDQVIQVLTNLVQNALDAVRGAAGATVTLTTDTDGHYVAFSVSDNGPGIAPEIAGRLFEPYATTKSSGTGLGLAIAQRIAIEHNGELSYLGPGPDGRGAVFRLLLPVEGPPPMSEAPSSDL